MDIVNRWLAKESGQEVFEPYLWSAHSRFPSRRINQTSRNMYVTLCRNFILTSFRKRVSRWHFPRPSRFYNLSCGCWHNFCSIFLLGGTILHPITNKMIEQRQGFSFLSLPKPKHPPCLFFFFVAFASAKINLFSSHFPDWSRAKLSRVQVTPVDHSLRSC